MRLNEESYLTLLGMLLEELMEIVPLSISNNTWIKHDEVPVYFSSDVRTYLNATIGNSWIGLGGPLGTPISILLSLV